MTWLSHDSSFIPVFCKVNKWVQTHYTLMYDSVSFCHPCSNWQAFPSQSHPALFPGDLLFTLWVFRKISNSVTDTRQSEEKADGRKAVFIWGKSYILKILRDLQQKWLELINEFSKVTGYKFNSKKTIPFTET